MESFTLTGIKMGAFTTIELENNYPYEWPSYRCFTFEVEYTETGEAGTRSDPDTRDLEIEQIWLDNEPIDATFFVEHKYINKIENFDQVLKRFYNEL